MQEKACGSPQPVAAANERTISMPSKLDPINVPSCAYLTPEVSERTALPK
jgi:hypothetical protein